jgi:hypothetical protein
MDQPAQIAQPSPAKIEAAAHSSDSSLREQALGHLFLGQLLAFMWRTGARDIEVLKSEVDRGGYDVVLEANCKSASLFTPNRRPTLTPHVAHEVIGTAKEISSWLGSPLDADGGQSSEPIHTERPHLHKPQPTRSSGSRLIPTEIIFQASISIYLLIRVCLCDVIVLGLLKSDPAT